MTLLNWKHATLFLLAALAVNASAATNPQPNIVFILADDLGYGDLGCYGQTVIKTPNLDRMAAEGLRFTQHYAGSAVCAPSRCSLMTGLHSGHSQIRGNGPSALRPDPQDITVATLLKRAGYQTAMIGKSSVAGQDDNPNLPNAKGFDHFFGYLHHTRAHDYFPTNLIRDGQTITYTNNHLDFGDTYSCDLFIRDALDWITQHKSGPFFLFYSTTLPHPSLYAPEDWKAKYRGEFSDAPAASYGNYRHENEPKTTYAAMVSRLDWEAGQILAKLKELGIATNTLVIFGSDNGAMNEGGHKRTDFNSSGSLRGGKRDLTEGGIRVPLIAQWPGKIEAGKSTTHVSAFWDFLPTACDLAQIKTPSGLDGISYLPTLLGKSNDQKQHEFLYWEFYEQGGKRAARLGQWKAIQLNLNNASPDPIQLYDLEADPGETNDIVEQHPDIVKRMRKIFEAEHTESASWSWSNSREKATGRKAKK
ncbi:MAG TPA: arylsulfatase [Verrucomicrobiae bacterium]|nr:arylsulfatase [Verrucomicrobiae bacterium]